MEGQQKQMEKIRQIDRKYKAVSFVGLMVLLLIGAVILPLGGKETKGTLSGLPATVNTKVTIEQTNNQDYIIIPVNTDLSKAEVTVTLDGKPTVIEGVSQFMKGLDTLVPSETNYKSTTDTLELDINFIVSDDLR